VLPRALDRPLEVELVLRPFAHEVAQAPQRDAHLADIERAVVAVVAEDPLLRDLHGVVVAALAADPDARRVVAVATEGGRSLRADVLRPAVVPLLLVAQLLLDALDQLLEIEGAQRAAGGLERALLRGPLP